MVCSWKKEKVFCFLPTQVIDLVPLSGHPLKFELKTLQQSTLQLNQLFSNGIHSIMNLKFWHLKSPSHQSNVLI